MAAGEYPEANCCYFHPSGCALHKQPEVNGKPFSLLEHKAQLELLGLTVFKRELQQMARANQKPQGEPRKIGKALIYPLPHFG